MKTKKSPLPVAAGYKKFNDRQIYSTVCCFALHDTQTLFDTSVSFDLYVESTVNDKNQFNVERTITAITPFIQWNPVYSNLRDRNELV